jgi:hypothetical protein
MKVPYEVPEQPDQVHQVHLDLSPARLNASVAMRGALISSIRFLSCRCQPVSLRIYPQIDTMRVSGKVGKNVTRKSTGLQCNLAMQIRPRCRKTQASRAKTSKFNSAGRSACCVWSFYSALSNNETGSGDDPVQAINVDLAILRAAAF